MKGEKEDIPLRPLKSWKFPSKAGVVLQRFFLCQKGMLPRTGTQLQGKLPRGWGREALFVFQASETHTESSISHGSTIANSVPLKLNGCFGARFPKLPSLV